MPLSHDHLETFVFDPHRAPEGEVSAMARELIAARYRITELQAVGDAYQRQYHQARDRVAELEAERDVSRSECGRLSNELTERTQWEDRARVRLNDALAIIASRDRVLAEARERVAELETKQPPVGYISGYRDERIGRVTKFHGGLWTDHDEATAELRAWTGDVGWRVLTVYDESDVEETTS